MNTILEKAKAESTTAKKPFAKVTDAERAALDALCAKLDAIHEASQELDAEHLRYRDAKLSTGEVVNSGDVARLKADAEFQADAARFAIYRDAMTSNLIGAKRAVWRNDGGIVIDLLKRALVEAEKRRAKLVDSELKEAAAVGETANLGSAGLSFLEKRIGSLKLDIAQPERRLGNKRCARAVLRDHHVDYGGTVEDAEI